jgi:hypothetical protein
VLGFIEPHLYVLHHDLRLQQGDDAQHRGHLIPSAAEPRYSAVLDEP